MASRHTEHYGLSQWEASDKVERTDFNADNAAVDGALHALAQSKAETAALSQLSGLVAQKADQTALEALEGRLDSKADPGVPCLPRLFLPAPAFGGAPLRLLRRPFRPAPPPGRHPGRRPGAHRLLCQCHLVGKSGLLVHLKGQPLHPDEF